MLSVGKKQLTKELLDLWENAPEDIKLLCNETDITDVQAIITGPSGTPYAGGHFHVKLALSNDYPQSPPRGFFLTKVFHPNVASPSGEICVNTLKKDWKSDLGIRHILLTIKCLLIAPNPESALNEEAGRMLMEDYESYAQRARMFTEIHAKPHVDAGDTAAAVSLDKSKTTTARKGGGNRSKSTTNNSTAKKMLKRL